MPLLRSNTADKIIVDRRKPHRNSEVARAVRRSRDQLTHRPGNPTFDRELLKQHARATARIVLAVPIMVLAAALAGFYLDMKDEILAWAVVTLAGYSALAVVARSADRTDASRLDVDATRRNFLIAHFVSGL